MSARKPISAKRVEELSDAARVFAPVATTVGVHSSQIEDLTAGFARIEAKIDTLNTTVLERVGAVERRLDYEQGVRDGAAGRIQDARQTLTLRIAQNSWIRPAISGGVLLLLAELLRHWLG